MRLKATHREVQLKKEYRTFLVAALAAGSVPVDAEKSKHLPLSVTEKAAQMTKKPRNRKVRGTNTSMETGG